MNIEYQIIDEPTSKSNRLITNPFWVMLAGMLGGAWIAALLFAVNGWLLRGPRWKFEIFLSFLLLACSPLILFLLVVSSDTLHLPRGSAQYLGLLITLWKVVAFYLLFFLQQGSYQLYEYFVGDFGNRQLVPTGVVYLGIGVFLRPIVVELFESAYWHVMVS